MNKHNKRIVFLPVMIALLAVFFSVHCFASSTPATTSSSVADVVEQVAQDAAGQIKQIVNNVVFPVIDLILGVLLFVKGATMWFEYKKGGNQINFVPIAVIFVGLLLSLTAPLYIWSIIGI